MCFRTCPEPSLAALFLGLLPKRRRCNRHAASSSEAWVQPGTGVVQLRGARAGIRSAGPRLHPERHGCHLWGGKVAEGAKEGVPFIQSGTSRRSLFGPSVVPSRESRRTAT